MAVGFHSAVMTHNLSKVSVFVTMLKRVLDAGMPSWLRLLDFFLITGMVDKFVFLVCVFFREWKGLGSGVSSEFLVCSKSGAQCLYDRAWIEVQSLKVPTAELFFESIW